VQSLFKLPPIEAIARDVVLLRQFANVEPLLAAIAAIAEQVPFHHLRTRGGLMSVAMTNCGQWGWHSDLRGYRYVDRDPVTEKPWPAMPEALTQLAQHAADSGGFPGFEPDCCLINRYAVGAQMGVHRDFDELDLRQPIVSVSIGLPATFLWYGPARSGTPLRVPVSSGDVLVWGASARTGYHAVRRVKAPAQPMPNPFRYNLTFRRAK
jgi:alkylated DNA repair protein (DNA oxidative demethylase)